MIIDVQFEEQDTCVDVDFGEVHTASDGGFELGYAAGYEVGNTEGYTKGHSEGVEQGYADGLAARQYETWTLTYVDGTVEDVEVALL